MTGTGTQNDPYIVDNWADFVTAVGTSGAYVEFPKNLVRTADTDVDPNKLYTDANGAVQTNVQPADLANLYENTFVLDANDYEESKYGLSDMIYLQCESFNGYGGYIKNIATVETSPQPLLRINRSMNQYVHFKNVAILNAYILNSLFYGSDYRGGVADIKNIIFSGEVRNTSSGSYITVLNTNGTVSGCAFTLKNIGDVKLINTSNYSPLDIKYSRVKLVGKLDSGTFYCCGEDCYFSGETNASIYLHGTNYRTRDSVVDCETPSVNSESSVSMTLVNSEKCGSVGSYLTPVTTTQLKDAAYLSSIGFPIQT